MTFLNNLRSIIFKNIKPTTGFCYKNYEIKQIHCRISDIFNSYEKNLNQEIQVSGWIRNIRKQKDITFIHLNDGSDSRNMQLIASTNQLTQLTDLNFGTLIKVSGQLVKSSHKMQEFELLVKNLEIINTFSPTSEYPFQMKKFYNFEYLRQHPHLRSNTNVVSSILRFRSKLNILLHSWFETNNFVHIHTPILSKYNCEGGCEVFEVNAKQDKKSVGESHQLERYFIEPTYLTASAQLHLETLTNSLGNVYTISPTFRAEKSLTRHHLAEFYMIEAELVNMEKLEDLLGIVENLLKYICKNVYNEFPKHDLEYILNYIEKSKENEIKNVQNCVDHVNLIKTLMSKEFIRLTYDNAIELLNKSSKFEKLKWGEDLGKNHESYLIDYHERIPVFIINYPKSLKPFYMRTSCLNENLVENFDLLVHNIGELVGGSLRESNYDLMIKNMNFKNINTEEYKLYLETKKFGGMRMGMYSIKKRRSF